MIRTSALFVHGDGLLIPSTYPSVGVSFLPCFSVLLMGKCIGIIYNALYLQPNELIAAQGGDRG